MVQISTLDQLLLMAYGELSPEDARSLQEQLKSDNNLAQEWHSILRITGQLDKLSIAPSETSFRIVIEHSHKSEHLQEI